GKSVNTSSSTSRFMLRFSVKKGTAVNHGFVLNHQTLCVSSYFDIKIIDLFSTN
ncbi:unnamed protein product, partial [Brassica oleracea]